MFSTPAIALKYCTSRQGAEMNRHDLDNGEQGEYRTSSSTCTETCHHRPNWRPGFKSSSITALLCFRRMSRISCIVQHHPTICKNIQSYFHVQSLIYDCYRLLIDIYLLASVLAETCFFFQNSLPNSKLVVFACKGNGVDTSASVAADAGRTSVIVALLEILARPWPRISFFDAESRLKTVQAPLESYFSTSSWCAWQDRNGVGAVDRLSLNLRQEPHDVAHAQAKI